MTLYYTSSSRRPHHEQRNGKLSEGARESHTLVGRRKKRTRGDILLMPQRFFFWASKPHRPSALEIILVRLTVVKREEVDCTAHIRDYFVGAEGTLLVLHLSIIMSVLGLFSSLWDKTPRSREPHHTPAVNKTIIKNKPAPRCGDCTVQYSTVLVLVEYSVVFFLSFIF